MFFEPPPPAGEERKEPPRPPWVGPDESELGTPVPVRMVLATSKDVVIALTDCVAFSNGFEFGISIRSREQLDHGAMGYGPPPPPGKALPDDLFRIGVQFSDGRKATTMGPHGAQFQQYFAAVREGKEPEAPEGPLMMPRGGGGGGRRWDHRYWVWTLPSEGKLTIACEWPAQGIPLTMHELDAGQIREAAATSPRLWEEEDGPGNGWSSWVSRSG